MDKTRYEVQKYGSKWTAYFKPDGWKVFGNSCEVTPMNHSVEYDSKVEAQEACERHSIKFGNDLNHRNNIKGA